MPRMNPASVLPMPVANCPKAPALQVCESVPNNTSPAGHPATIEPPVPRYSNWHLWHEILPLRQMQVESRYKHACTWLTVTLLGQGHMAYALVVGVSPEVASVCDVVEVLDAILLHHISACQNQNTIAEARPFITQE